MVYLEPHQLGWQPLLVSWMSTLPSSLGTCLIERIGRLFSWLLPACLRFVRKTIKEVSPTEDANIAHSAMNLFISLLDEFQSKDEGELPMGSLLFAYATSVFFLLQY